MKIRKVGIGNKNVELSGISPILYHATSVNKLADILKDNRIHMASNLGTKADQVNTKKFLPYYFSMSRVKYGGYTRTIAPAWLSILVMDGRVLQEKYSGRPVDYWGKEFRQGDTDSRLRYDENEDRIFSSEPYIEPLNKYVKEIHIMLSEEGCKRAKKIDLTESEWEQYFKMSDYYKAITQFAKVYHIPAYFYADFSAFKTLNKRKAESGWQGRDSTMGAVNELLAKDVGQQLSKEADDVRYRLHFGSDRRDLQITLENELHNSRGGQKSERIEADELIGFMRKLKLHSVDKVLDYLAEKYRSVEN